MRLILECNCRTHSEDEIWEQDGNIAISLSILRSLFEECSKRFKTSRKTNDPKILETASKCLLVLYPDNYTAWNVRKRLISEGHLNIHQELVFLSFLSTKSPKKTLIWSHWEWNMQRAPLVLMQWDRVSLVLDRAASRYPCNYSVWHLRWMLLCRCQEELSESQTTLAETIFVSDEWAWLTRWLGAHPTDISGWSYAQSFIRLMCQHRPDIQEKAWAFVARLWDLYPGSEGLLKTLLSLSQGHSERLDSLRSLVLSNSPEALFPKALHPQRRVQRLLARLALPTTAQRPQQETITMAGKKYDLLVIGAGSGGIATARRAASYGAKVGIIEGARYGGTCVNVGCVPKKVMWNAATLKEALHDASGYGFSVDVNGFAWGALKKKRDAYIERLNGCVRLADASWLTLTLCQQTGSTKQI